MKLFVLRLLLIVAILSTSITIGFSNQLYIVHAKRLNIREKIKTDRLLGYVKDGDTVNVINDSNTNWYKIKVDNGEGYVRSKYLTPVKNLISESDEKSMSNKDKLIAGSLFIFVLSCVIGLILLSKTERKFSSTIAPVNSTVIVKQKSMAMAIVLSFFLGPIGMFYSTIKGALTMIALPIISLFIFLGMIYRNSDGKTIGMFFYTNLIFYSLFYWLTCIIWAAVAANKRNRAIIQSL